MKLIHKIPILFFYLLYPIKVYGRENVPEGGTVFVSNHFRAADCGFIARAYTGDVKFLAKKEIFKNKLISKIVKSYGGIPIDRDNPDMKSILEAIRTIKDGKKLCIFVEGTRNKTGTNELQSIKGGAVVFAVKAKCPIVPIMMMNKARIFRRLKIIIGKPFTLEQFYGLKLDDEQIEKMNEVVRAKMIEQQEVLKEIVASKKVKKKAK